MQYPFYSKTNKYHMTNHHTNDLARKQDTRKKILLGGLVIKAGLDYLHPQDVDVLYGLLLANKKLLTNKPEIAAKWREIGKDLKKI